MILTLDNFYVAESSVHNMGVFTNNKILKDSEFYIPYVRICKKGVNESSPFKEYIFPLGRDYKCIMGEFGSFINHSNDPNIVIEYTLPEVGYYQKFRVTKDLDAHQEIFLNYGPWAVKKFGNKDD